MEGPTRLALTQRAAIDPFLTLPENRFACAALEQFRRAPRGTPVLVSVSGPSGCGKTHLVRLALAELRQRDHRLRIVQIEARELASPHRAPIPDLPDAACSDDANPPDVLVCEDLQSLENSACGQNRLVAALDLVLSCGGRVLVTARGLPGELPFSQRLVSRLHAGICASLRLPEVPSRSELLACFSRRLNLLLPPEVVRFLAEQLAVSPRELSAAARQLAALARAEHQALVNLELARRIVAAETFLPRPTTADIARAVARQFNVSVREIQSASRARRLLRPRQCAMYLSRELTDDSLEEIGRYYGRSNHSTVAHACRRIRGRLPEEPSLRRQLRAIRQSLQGSDRKSSPEEPQ